VPMRGFFYIIVIISSILKLILIYNRRVAILEYSPLRNENTSRVDVRYDYDFVRIMYDFVS